jgi:hypothetical protein
VYDGTPPRLPDEDDDDAEDEKPGATKGSSGPPAAGVDVKPSSPPKPAQ